MKFFLLLLLAQIGFSGVSPYKGPSLKKNIESVCLKDWPDATRVEVESISTQESAPETAVLTDLNPRPTLGVVSFNLDWQEKGLPRKTRGTALVKVFQKIAVAKKNITHGDPFAEESVDFREMELSRFQRSGVFASWEELEGKVAKGFIRSGNVVTQNQVDRPVEIRHGQMVDLQLENNQVVITAKMKALEGGKSGQWIKVENPNSKRVLRARITGTGQVSLR